jgi:hypothetical protein
MSGSIPLTDPAVLIAHSSFNLTAAAMAGIERATIDQGSNVVLDAASLRHAIFSGITKHLSEVLQKRKKMISE